MFDRVATISRAFGVLQMGFCSGQVKLYLLLFLLQMRTGNPANSVFIVEGEDRVHHHKGLDSRVAFSVEEVARLVEGFSTTNGGQVSLSFAPALLTPLPQPLAMADWRVEKDTVANNIQDIRYCYGYTHG